MLFPLSLISHVAHQIQEHNDFVALCNSLPPEQAEKLKAERKEKFRLQEEHRKALELANASRPRNFWGQ